MTVSPSTKTYGNIYNELNQFISKNQNMDKLDDAAKEAGYNLLSNVIVTANDQLLGSIKNSRPVIDVNKRQIILFDRLDNITRRKSLFNRHQGEPFARIRGCLLYTSKKRNRLPPLQK